MMKIELTEQQWNVVGRALVEVPMPYKISAPILAELERQVVEAKNCQDQDEVSTQADKGAK